MSEDRPQDLIADVSATVGGIPVKFSVPLYDRLPRGWRKMNLDKRQHWIEEYFTNQLRLKPGDQLQTVTFRGVPLNEI